MSTKTNPSIGIFFFLACLCLPLSGVAATPEQPDDRSKSTIWASEDQFVKLAPQDALKEGETPPNQHPRSVQAEKITAALSNVRVLKEKTLFSESAMVSLLKPQFAALLGQKLAQAFEQAKPGQDVLFAIATLAETGAIGQEKVSVAGRAFFSDDRLNIIIGDLFVPMIPQEFYSHKARPMTIDRRLQPHLPGRRDQEREHSQHFVEGKGLSLNQVNGALRKDWLVLEVDDSVVSPNVAPPADKSLPTGEAGAQPSSQATTKPDSTVPLETRLRRLRELREQNLIEEKLYEDLVREAIQQDLQQ